MNFLELCKTRYSGRDYDRSHPVEEEKMQAILDAAHLAPSGCNSQQWKALLIESPEGLVKAEICSSCVYNAPAVLLFLYDDAHPDSHLDINGVNVGLTNCVIAATHAMLAAREQGVDSCWVCWFEEEKIRQEFRIPENWNPAMLLLLGYDKEGPSERHTLRKPMEELIERV